MTDEQFDDLARGALAHDAGPPSEAVWKRVKPQRWPWLPTVREILACGAIGALALLIVGAKIERSRPPAAQPNPVIQAAMHDETRFVLSEVTRIPGAPPKSGL